MKTTVEEIRKVLAEFPDNMEVRPRFMPLMNDIDNEHVSARIVTYVELNFNYHRMARFEPKGKK